MLWNNRNVTKTKSRNKDLKQKELPFLQIKIDMLTTKPLITSNKNPRHFIFFEHEESYFCMAKIEGIYMLQGA
jgi:hypothetical protein